MAKCGFCHVAAGHNRRTCDKIAALREAGHSVKSTHTIEDFPDFFNSDSDFEPDKSDDSLLEPAEKPPVVANNGQTPVVPAPSDNPRNVPADPTRRSPSPIISRSLDELAEDNGLFDDSLGSVSPFLTPDSRTGPPPRAITARPLAQHRLRAPAGFATRHVPDINSLPYIPPSLRPRMPSPAWAGNSRTPYQPLQFSSAPAPRAARPPVSAQ